MENKKRKTSGLNHIKRLERLQVFFFFTFSMLWFNILFSDSSCTFIFSKATYNILEIHSLFSDMEWFSLSHFNTLPLLWKQQGKKGQETFIHKIFPKALKKARHIKGKTKFFLFYKTNFKLLSCCLFFFLIIVYSDRRNHTGAYTKRWASKTFRSRILVHISIQVPNFGPPSSFFISKI